MENVPWSPPGSLFGDGSAGWPPGRSGIVRIMVRENPFRTRIAEAEEQEVRQLEEAIAERRCREQTGFGTFAEAASEFRPHPCCPSCGSARTKRDGLAPNGVQRWECLACGRKYTSLAGTVFEHARYGLPKWVSFIGLMRYNVPLDCIAETLQISHQTAWEWRHRVFATVDGYQDRTVLRKRVWIDETYIVDSDLAHGYGQARKRGLSSQQLCIAVGIDVFKNPYAVVCGHGKPSTKRIREAFGGHIAEGATVVHDRERAHTGIIRDAGAVSESYKADVNDPEYLESMELVNNLCSWLKRYLWRFTGMSMSNMQSYLNWYVYLFRVNQAKDRWPETARVVRHMMMSDASFRSST